MFIPERKLCDTVAENKLLQQVFVTKVVKIKGIKGNLF